VLRAIGVTPKTELENSVSMVELVEMIAQSRSEGLLDPEEHRRLSRALQIRDRVANDVAVPADRIRSVPVASDGTGPRVADIEQALAETGYSRFPVVDSGGRFTGFVHIKDMLDLLDHPDAAISASAVRHLPRLPADMALPETLSRLRQTNSHLALLTGDNGQVSGMVTLEDLVEDLVGTVRDGTHRA
jgi:CBS domain containing-hemolysin-like protein